MTFVPLVTLFPPLSLSGVIPAWSWCCGDPRTIPSLGSEGARYRNRVNNKRYLGSLWLRVHLPPLTVPPVHLQKHIPLCTAFLWPTALERRTWKCDGAGEWKSHPKEKDWICSHIRDHKGLRSTWSWSVWRGMLVIHEYCAFLKSLCNTCFTLKSSVEVFWLLTVCEM